MRKSIALLVCVMATAYAQDKGSMLLNLYNNAFTTLSANAPYLNTTSPGNNVIPESKFEPMFTMSTKNVNGIIKVKVTGNGIPQHKIDKLFQPFYTTKGQSAGRVLSLTYDIVKVHGGEIKVVNAKGAGGSFIVRLPL